MNSYIIDELMSMGDYYNSIGDDGRKTAYERAVESIKSYNKPIKSGAEAKTLRWIGDGIAAKIDDIFSDRTKAGIRLSSIHKAKGLEADRVFFLQLPKARCPHPMAKTPWQYEQEKNLLYVAYTRAIRELIIVS